MTHISRMRGAEHLLTSVHFVMASVARCVRRDSGTSDVQLA